MFFFLAKKSLNKIKSFKILCFSLQHFPFVRVDNKNFHRVWGEEERNGKSNKADIHRGERKQQCTSNAIKIQGIDVEGFLSKRCF